MKRAVIVLVALIGCRQESVAPVGTPGAGDGGARPPQHHTIAFPVAEAVVPYVASGGLISFVDENARAFRLITYRDGKWSEPRTIATDESMMINRADFPSVAISGNEIVAAWSTRKEHGTIVHVARSADGGETWSKPVTPHPELVSQFGFVSLAGDEAVYLDGRKLKGGMEGEGEMELRALNGTALDPRVCDCCQTAMAMTSEGPVVAYRDRSADEVRDISIVRKTAAGWTEPKTLHADGWKIAGCPVNGPQLDADGRRVVAAWFTAASNDPRVFVAFSADAGATFSAPVRVDDGQSAGRVDVVILQDGSAAVTWVGQRDGKSQLYARRVLPTGMRGGIVELGEASGFPRAARWNENVAVVWSMPDGVQVRLIERL